MRGIRTLSTTPNKVQKSPPFNLQSYTFAIAKRYKSVPQAVPKSICHRISSVMGFGTSDFDYPEAMVL
jgi:hypothetical protein